MRLRNSNKFVPLNQLHHPVAFGLFAASQTTAEKRPKPKVRDGSHSNGHILTQLPRPLSPSRTRPIPHPLHSYFIPSMLLRSYVSVWLCFLFVCFSVHSHSRLIFPRTCWPTVSSRTYSSAWLDKLIVFYSTPTSVPRRLFSQLLLSISPIQTITTFTTQYIPFLITGIHTIAHLCTFFPSTHHPPTLHPTHPPKAPQHWHPRTRNWIMSNSVSWPLSVVNQSHALLINVRATVSVNRLTKSRDRVDWLLAKERQILRQVE